MSDVYTAMVTGFVISAIVIAVLETRRKRYAKTADPQKAGRRMS
jgi:hypothetical protein